nr:superoxide dismutase [Mn], mitochondrial-like [Tanacetum cinerariifolium]
MALRTLSNGKTLGLFSKLHQQIRGLQTFTLPDFSYDYGALEPAISGEITQIHHQKHHQTYITNYNKALEQLDHAIAKGDASTVVKLQSAIKFNGGGHAGGGEPPHGSLGWAIDQHFGSMEKLIAKVSVEGAAVQGSGLVWHVVDKELKRIVVETTTNQ